MFDSRMGGAPAAPTDAATTLSQVSAAHRQIREHECRLLELAEHWADLHHPASQAPAEKMLPGAEQARQLGGEGTPEVLEFAPAELAAQLETSYGSGRSLMADALDLRHRLPELWQLILTSAVPSWKARKVAQATRHLSRSSAMHVDAAVAPAIAGLPWARFENLLTGKIIEADPYAAEQQAKIWEAERFVQAGRTNQHGLKLLIAKANAGNVILFMATVNRIAEILKLQGDMDSADVRRSKAIGILAQPALASQLLREFRNEQHSAADQPQEPDEPVHNDPEAPYDNGTTPPDDDLFDSAAKDPRRDRSEGMAAESMADSSEPATQPTAAAQPEHDRAESIGRGLIIQPSAFDVRKLRPQVILHIHLSEEALAGFQCDRSRFGGGVARMEGVGPVTLSQVRRFLADTACDIKVQPVIDPANSTPVDSYEIPRRIREAMFLRMPASCFPYATAVGRLELDHTIAYFPPARGGPPGQTGVHGLGPFIRFEHRIKTHGRWRVRQPEPGVLDLALAPRHALSGHQYRHPQPRHRTLRPQTLARRNSDRQTARAMTADSR